jgi:hypothetical protein
MADEDDVAEDWEDVDTEVRKLLAKKSSKMSTISVVLRNVYSIDFPS